MLRRAGLCPPSAWPAGPACGRWPLLPRIRPVADVVTTDLEGWARRKSAAYERMGETVAAGARRGIFHLLQEGIRHAPKHTGALRRSLRVYDRRRGDTVDLALRSDDPAAGATRKQIPRRNRSQRSNTGVSYHGLGRNVPDELVENVLYDLQCAVFRET